MINKYDGEYTIASYNEDWVRAKESTFEDYLQAVNNQNKFFSQSIYQSIIQNGLMIILGTSIYYFLFRTLFPESIRAENISFLALLILSYLIAGIISYILSQKFFDLYPKIEFDTTRNHLNTKKKTRNRLITFLSIILIPFIIGIISNSIF